MDGNENIVGVEELPRKYRSHKKLYLPLDTIFVDRDSFIVKGEGVKNSDYTRNLMEIIKNDSIFGQNEIFTLFENILNRNIKFNQRIEEQKLSLIQIIEAKFELRTPISQEWIMF